MTEGFVFWESTDNDVPVSVRVCNQQPRAFIRDKLTSSWDEAIILARAVKDLSAERDRYKALYFEQKSEGWDVMLVRQKSPTVHATLTEIVRQCDVRGTACETPHHDQREQLLRFLHNNEAKLEVFDASRRLIRSWGDSAGRSLSLAECIRIAIELPSIRQLLRMVSILPTREVLRAWDRDGLIDFGSARLYRDVGC